MSFRRFSDCSVSEKLLDTFFILLIGTGYLLAMALLYATVAPMDGKPGLSAGDIVIKYYGNRSGTRLEEVMKGPMRQYHNPAEHEEVMAWIYSGATQTVYDEKIRPILESNCTGCHNPNSGLAVPALTDYEKAAAFAKTDTGMSLSSLARVSHIHLFGVTLVFYLLGRIFIQSELPVWLKRFIVAVPFAAIAVDIGSWWLTKYAPVFAYAVLIGGGIMGISMGAQIIISLHQMWLASKNQRAGL